MAKPRNKAKEIHQKKSITIMVPAYNEEKNLAKTISRYNNIVKTLFDDYEFIIFDDCSSDRTGEIADRLAKKNKHIKIVHNKQNRGVGYNYREGIKLSQKDYYIYFNGKGEVIDSSVREILSRVGEAGIIISYIGNQETRPLYRRIISNAFTILLNALSGFHLKYYTGPVIYKTKVLKKIKTTTGADSIVYFAEVLIRVLRQGCSYKELPFYIKETKGTNFFRIKNIIKIFFDINRLFFDVGIRK